jgi:hypothetical protein
MKEKAIIARVPHELWHYVKRSAVDDNTTMSGIVNEYLIKYQYEREKKLTSQRKVIT